MTNKKINLALVLLFTAALSGCGGEESEPLEPTSASLVLGTFASQIINKLPTSDSLPSLPVTGVSVGTSSTSASVMAASCETITPSPLVDEDGDGVAKEKTYTFDCTDLADNGNKITRKGTIKIKDLDDTVGGVFGGIRVDYDLPIFKSDDNTGKEYNYQYIGYWDYSSDGNSLLSKSEYLGKTSYTYKDGLTNDYTYTYTWNYRYTPDNSALRWNSGQIDIEGSFRLKGLFVNEDANGNHSQGEGSFYVNYKGVGLKQKSGCSKTYSEGTYTIDDGNGTTVEIRYFCSSAKLYVNGAESDWWTP